MSKNNAMKNPEFLRRQKVSVNLEVIKKARSDFLKINNPSFNTEIVEKRIKTYCVRLANGSILNQGNSKGFYLSESGVQEWYDGAFELDFMKYLDSKELKWTKKHGLIIPYINKSKLNSFYVPDFLVENNIIVETKGFFKLKKELLKIPAALTFCKNNGYSFIYLKSTKIKNGYSIKMIENYSLIQETSYAASTVISYADNRNTP
jgi:hypothetical protein